MNSGLQVVELCDDTKALFNHLHRGGEYAYYWKLNEETGKKAACWWSVGQPPIYRIQGNDHLYFGVHPTRKDKEAYQRATLDDVAAINCLFAEFDMKDFNGDKHATLDHVMGLPKPPSVVIDSGGGFHCYWLLYKPFLINSVEDRRKAQYDQAAWVKHVGSDDGAKDLVRVLRVPGTKNVKPAYGPDFPEVQIVRADFDCLYDIAELAALVPPQPARTQHEPRIAVDSDDELLCLAGISAGLVDPERADTYQGWVDFGMQVYQFGDAGLKLWHQWSKQSTKYDPDELDRKWPTFESDRDDKQTVYSLFHTAKQDSPFEYEQLIYPVLSQRGKQEAKAQAVDSGNKRQKDESASTLLINIGREAELFCATDGTAYARCTVGDHTETWAFSKAGGFRRWLQFEFYKRHGFAPNSNAMTDAMSTLEAIASFEGERNQVVYTRVARVGDKIYLDLANDEWEVVEITKDGWRVSDASPVHFRRTKGMLPLPHPERGGRVDEIKKIINVSSDDDFKLVVGWLLGVLEGNGPYAHLAFYGEQGAAKSSATRMLRGLIDPNDASIRAMPKEERDLAIWSQNAGVIALDNLSHIPEWLSDAMCRLSTGAAASTRALFTDDDEKLFSAKRPVVFNGITEVATRGDLIDRTLIVELDPIAGKRMTEREVDDTYNQLRPRILGALLEAASAALRNLETTKPERLPRLADFATWVEAAAPALGWKANAFIDAMFRMREEANEIELEGSIVATKIIEVIKSRWTGSATELNDKLKASFPFGEPPKDVKWPGNPRALSGSVKRLAPALRRKGVGVRQWRTENGASITIEPGNPGLGLNDANLTQNMTQTDFASGIGDFASSRNTAYQSDEVGSPDANDANDAKSRRSSPSLCNDYFDKDKTPLVEQGDRGQGDHGRDFASFASFASGPETRLDTFPQGTQAQMVVSEADHCKKRLTDLDDFQQTLIRKSYRDNPERFVRRCELAGIDTEATRALLEAEARG